MTRGKKQSFAIDAQRGEGSAERERLLRAQPLEAEVTDFSPAVQPLPEQPPQTEPQT